MAQRGNIDTIAPSDVENAFTGFEGKLVAVDNDYILISHNDMALLCGTFWKDNYLTETPMFVKSLLGSGVIVYCVD